MEQFVSQDLRSNSSYFDLKFGLGPETLPGPFEKRAPGLVTRSFLGSTPVRGTRICSSEGPV